MLLQQAQGQCTMGLFDWYRLPQTCSIQTMYISCFCAGHLTPHRYLGIAASARASAYIYNTPQEIDTFIEALEDTIKFFKEL